MLLDAFVPLCYLGGVWVGSGWSLGWVITISVLMSFNNTSNIK